MTRPNWYYRHPPACTCVDCKEARRSEKTQPTKKPHPGHVWERTPPDRPSAASLARMKAIDRSARERTVNRKLDSRILVFPLSASLTVLAGAVFGVLLIFPLLPDAVAGIVVDLQQEVSEIFRR